MKHKLFSLVYLLSCALVCASVPCSAVNAQGLDQRAVLVASVATMQQANGAEAALLQGRRLLKRGKANEALGPLQNALKLFTDADNQRGIAAARNELGDLYVRQGQYKVALTHYQSAYDAFRTAQAKQDSITKAIGIADTEFNANLMLAKIGNTHYMMGDMSGASAAYSQIQTKKPESTATQTKRRFGGVGGLMGAVATGKVSVEAPTSVAGIAMEARKQLEQYRTAIVFATKEIGMGRIDYFNNQFDPAKKHFQDALDATSGKLPGLSNLGQMRRFRASARTSLGDVSLQQARYKDATKFYTDAAKGAQDDKRLDLIWPAQRGLGKSLLLQASQERDANKAGALREQAISGYRDALKTIETIRQGSLRADEARTSFLATTKDVFDEASNALAEMALLSAPAAGSPLQGKALDYAAEAFKITEQSRARSLLDMLNETDAQITEGVPADLLKRKQDNLDRQQEIAQSLSGISTNADEPKKKPTDLEAELEQLQTEYDALENQIRAASPRYASLTATEPLTLGAVQQQVLDDGTTLLEYNLGAQNSYLWAVTNNSTTLYRLPNRSELDGLAVGFRAQLIPAKLQRRLVGIDVAEAQPQRGLGLGVAAPAPQEAAAFAAASNALFKAAVEPAASLIGEKRLLIVADGALNYVPFEALVKTGGGTDYSALPYLIKTNEIAYAPSASVLAAVRQQGGSKPAGRNILLVADPVFNSNDARARSGAAAPAAASQAQGTDVAARGLGLDSAVADVDAAGAASAGGAQGAGLPLMRLSGTRTEAEQIAKLARTTGAQADVWLDLNASEDNIETRDMTKYRVVHIATHGLLNTERPQFTGLVLSLVGNKKEDGFLRTDEVFNLKLGSPLVILSACETGLGKEKRGEGVIGLTRAFMYAGAPTVGVSLWSVADRSTAELMTNFYKRLLTGQGTSPANALRAAQTDMIAGKKYSAPFYWSPFILVGEWRQ
ncbi:MAG TPA: CHAT domain-containing protein [Pyrinomonadaceae bacterium]|jgi:CHAT domain-containing protein|nr:CHAT domain-containing protein [Pyrinomonadaceae bacterium]